MRLYVYGITNQHRSGSRCYVYDVDDCSRYGMEKDCQMAVELKNEFDANRSLSIQATLQAEYNEAKRNRMRTNANKVFWDSKLISVWNIAENLNIRLEK